MTDVPADKSVLLGGARPAPAALLGPADPGESFSVSIVLRRRPDGPPFPDLKKLAMTPPRLRRYLSREEFAARFGAAQADVDRVAAFACTHGLAIEETSIARRTILVSGSVAQFNRAFAVELMRYQSTAGNYLSYAGNVYVPNGLRGIVEDVLGLDREPLSISRLGPPALPAIPPTITPLTPPQVAMLYQFPSGTGVGETIGILEFDGGFNQRDINEYFAMIVNMAPPAPVTFYSVDGATNDYGTSIPADREQLIDICVASSVAPEATIVVYKVPPPAPPLTNFQRWYDCVSTAIHDSAHNPSVLTCSWSGNETGWAKHTAKMSSLFGEAQTMGVTILFASGDGGDQNPPLIQYPPSDPGVTACGGTLLENVSGSSFDQVGWRFSTGGVSALFPRPSSQDQAGTPPTASGFYGRGVPDVAGNADKYSGYMIRRDGQTEGPFAGTSAVAPLYAALIAIINQNLNTKVGFLNYYLYASATVYPQTFDDVVNGSNAVYACREGWDAVTGLGSVNGETLQRVLGNPCWALQKDVDDLQAEIQVIINSVGSGELPPSETKGALQEVSQLIDGLIAARQALAKCRKDNPV